jgi:hypothetical protein
MGFDLDDVFSYTTNKTVTIRHRWLGLLYYSLLLLVVGYIFGVQIIYQERYNLMMDVNGMFQANVLGVGSDKLRPLANLTYCGRRYVNNYTYSCAYPAMATGILSKVGAGVEGSLLIGTRLSTVHQHHNARCTDQYRCSSWIPEPGTDEYEGAKETVFVGDVESSTVRFRHRVSRDTEAAFGSPASPVEFLNTFSDKTQRESSRPRMCLERDHTRCIDPSALISSGDIFTVAQLLRLAGASLDAPTTQTSYRYDGITLKVRVGYSSPQHYDYFVDRNDLEFTDISVAPTPTNSTTRMLYDLHGVLRRLF